MAAQVISFRCTLKNRLGQTLSHTENREVLAAEGEEAGPLSALSSALRDLSKGEHKTVVINAKDAYGFYDPSLVVTRFREELIDGDTLRLGQTVNYVKDGVVGKYRVVEASSLAVTLDGNHPLAGQDLVFEIEVTESRKADPEEEFVETAPGEHGFFH